ncbi:MAG: type II secretion system protein GspE, partial [Myxococcales bacterium]|nr:type II secretion system protein GspE [Myxococcales bacterium]
MKTTKARLGELLIARGALDTASVERLLNRQRDEHRRLGELILEEGLVGEGALREALAEQHGLGSVDLSVSPPAPNALSLVPIDVIRRCEAVPLAVEGQTLYVAMVDPDNVLAREELRFASGYTSLRIALITATDFTRFV